MCLNIGAQAYTCNLITVALLAQEIFLRENFKFPPVSSSSCPTLQTDIPVTSVMCNQ